jgi:hypothetical protein
MAPPKNTMPSIPLSSLYFICAGPVKMPEAIENFAGIDYIRGTLVIMGLGHLLLGIWRLIFCI